MAMHTDQVKSNHSLPTARRLQPATYLNSGYKSDILRPWLHGEVHKDNI